MTSPTARKLGERLKAVDTHAGMPEHFEFVRDIIDALGIADEALEKIASFAYGCPVDKTCDAREARAAVSEKLKEWVK